MKATKMQHYLEGWGSASFYLNVIANFNPIEFVWGYVKYCEIHCSCFTQLIIVITVAMAKVGRKHIRLHHVTQSVTFRDKSPFFISVVYIRKTKFSEPINWCIFTYENNIYKKW